MNVNINNESSTGDAVRVRRRNPQGSETDQISASVPKEISQTINGIVVTSTKSRSLVISELLAEALAAREL